MKKYIVKSNVSYCTLQLFLAGGVHEAVKFLLDRGAHPNSKGHFGRSPLYRAAFAGHLEATQVGLNEGQENYVVQICSAVMVLNRMF